MHFGGWRLALAFTPNDADDQRLEEAVELARRSDVALVFAGMPEHYETEGWDRPHMDLPGRQNELIAAVAKANPNTVVVLNVGSPVTMPWLQAVPAIVEAYYPGQEAGDAVARVLLGEVNPSGKLPETFPVELRDTPSYLQLELTPGCAMSTTARVFSWATAITTRRARAAVPVRLRLVVHDL